jgi:hypothetical protein
MGDINPLDIWNIALTVWWIYMARVFFMSLFMNYKDVQKTYFAPPLWLDTAEVNSDAPVTIGDCTCVLTPVTVPTVTPSSSKITANDQV